MSFLTTVHTDVGIKKSTNQDSALLMEAQTDFGSVLLSVICDGMGGLAKGEVASATVIDAFVTWFEHELPKLLHREDCERMIFGEWEELIMDCNQKIAAYAAELKLSMGTTLNALLFLKDKYYIVNVGDSRAYLLTDALYQLTKDHSFVQREMDMGRMTPEEAAVSPRRNVLLQCVGASPIITPDYFSGNYAPGQVYMQCSDGFRHAVTPEEIYQYLNPEALTDEATMKENAVYLTELNKNRRETDNITVLAVKVI
ncbi:MAG: serine/threonine-protein phosphatase [Ruminococcus sp.]|nr:serine/threonine-protein phosphatase [Ruminococcus sp.]